MKTRGGKTPSKSNNAYNRTNKTYKRTSENNAHNAQQNRFWSSANSPASSNAYRTNKTYKRTSENNAHNAQQNLFWSSANSPASGNAITYVPRAPRKVPVLYNGVNYNEAVPGPKKRTLMNRLFGRKNNTKKMFTGLNAGTGKATRHLNIGD